MTLDFGRPNPLPRELASSVFWLGECLEQRFEGKVLHACNAPFLVRGDSASLLVEGGHPKDVDTVAAQLEHLLATGDAPLRYVFCSHQETPHSAAIGRILEQYPDAILCGDVRDYHLVFPEVVNRFHPMGIGEEIDLGGTSFRLLDPVIKDLPSTQWGLATATRTLFPSDGFAYSHYHRADQCGRTAEEAAELNIVDMTALFAELALYWTKFTNMTPYIERLTKLVAELEVELIMPTHGLPITDVAATLPSVYEGLRLGSENCRREPTHQ